MSPVSDSVVASLAAAFDIENATSVRKRVEALIAGAEAREGSDEGEVATLVDAWNEKFSARKDSFSNLDNALADLSSWLGVKKRSRTTAREIGSTFADHYLPALTVLGVLATTFYGYAYTVFYKAVDATPEQVGVTTTDALARSAVGGVTFIVFAGAVLFFMLAPIVAPASGSDAPEAGHGSGEAFAGQLALIALGVGAWLGTASLVADLSVTEAAPIIVPLVVIQIVLCLRVNFRKRPRFYIAPLRFKPREFGVLYLTSVAGALVVLAGVTLWMASHDGDRASDGLEVEPDGIIGVPLLGLSAEPAFLTWRDAKPADFTLPRCVLYLGQDGDTTTVYDAKQRRTIQLPGNEVIVTIRHDRTSCTAPINEAKPAIAPRPHHVLECRPGKWSAYPEPSYRYTWTRNGYEMEPKRWGTLKTHPNDFDHAYRCRVEATTGFGSDVAYSRFIVVGRDRRTSRWAGLGRAAIAAPAGRPTIAAPAEN